MPTIYTVPREGVAELLALPETGMGFQIVTGRFRGTRSKFLVWNAEQALDMSEMASEVSFESDLVLGAWIFEAFSSPIRIIAAPAPKEFQLAETRISAPQNMVAPAMVATTVAHPSTLVKSVTLTAARRFHRFSPFFPDRRVNPVTGDFSPGTYACPDSEVPFVPTGFAAVGRFALPSSSAASHHYVVEAGAGTAVLFGTVAPAFGQAGGGVEALLPSGAKNVASPAISPSLIPDE